jgi:hypothetical protein
MIFFFVFFVPFVFKKIDSLRRCLPAEGVASPQEQ